MLRDGDMTTKLKRCFFFRKSINYWGLVITAEILKVTQKTTKAIELLQYPEEDREISLPIPIFNELLTPQ